ncbi:hypothetical protein [Streptomyces chrestomyceticus]|uniref:hypothetical protein n=1 Tax=Streptomyces chrestomyceticus TaxID=68185 RepID=UPI0037912184
MSSDSNQRRSVRLSGWRWRDMQDRTAHARAARTTQFLQRHTPPRPQHGQLLTTVARDVIEHGLLASPDGQRTDTAPE